MGSKLGVRRGPYKKFRATPPQSADTSVRYIALTQGQFAIVDATDFESISKFKWNAKWSNATRSFYAVRRDVVDGRWQTIGIHNELLGAKSVDHKNHNTLDNRRENLRPCTASQNLANQRRGPARGTTFVARQNKWQSCIRFNGKKIHLGTFDTQEEAHAVYLAKAKELFGEFAPQES